MARMPKPAVMWADRSCLRVTNAFGEWELGVPRKDLSADQINQLGPGFRIVWEATAAQELDAELPDIPIPAGPVGWATAWAHWGDTIACMANAKYLLEQKDQASCDFIYTGPDAAMVEFLRAQPWVNRVIRGAHEHKPTYLQAYSLAAYEDASKVAYLGLIETPEFPHWSEITPTHPSLHRTVIYRVRPAKHLRLPETRRAWARKWWAEWESSSEQRQEAGAKVIMLHPVSVWSETAANHWPHTREAIEWLLRETPHTYLLTGLEHVGIEHDRLVDLVGATPTNMEVLALAEMCDGVVSTCNSVGHWTVVQDIPGLIFGNRVMDDLGYWFRRHIDREPNTWINVYEGFPVFVEKAGEWLASLDQKGARRRAAGRPRGRRAA